jgi:pyruvate dehydrogenase E2 component (dihydrolipoamide acetyltransferase)
MPLRDVFSGYDKIMELSSEKKQIPLTRIQKLINKRMLESKRTKPCFYLESDADVTELMGSRSKLKKSLGVRITSNAFLIRAMALAVKEYPLMLGTLQGRLDDEDAAIKIPDLINVGFAVNAPQGLVVPVIKQADVKSLAEIATLEKQLIEKSRSNELTLQDIEGETIALSNLGAYGIDSFGAIVPPQTSAVVAVGNVIKSIVVRDGKPACRKLMSLTLAADAKIINGPYGARFLSCVVQYLENPEQLI